MPANCSTVKSIVKRKREYLVRCEQIKSTQKQEAAQKRKVPDDSDTEGQPKRKKQKPVEQEQEQFSLSKNVENLYPAISPVSINDIISTNTEGHMPRKMNVLCRVKDFYPPSLKDFVVAFCHHCSTTYTFL